MAKPVLEIAGKLVLAHVTAGGISPEEMPEALAATHQQLLSLQSREASGIQPTTRQPESRLTDWKKSITKNAVICLECGAPYKQLASPHLRKHHLDNPSYRQKYGIPKTQPLASKATTARRKAHAQQSRLWEKSPTYLKAHGRAVLSQAEHS